MRWVLTKLGIRGRQQDKIHRRGPPPLERGVEVSIWRRRPRVGTRRGGGAEGACGRESIACGQASQGGLVVRPAKGVGARLRFGRGGSSVGEHAAVALGHAHWSMRHSHTRATNTNW